MRAAKPLAALALLAAAAGLYAKGEPTLEDEVRRLAPELDRRLAAREVHVDPGELLSLMHDNRVRLAILDLRDERDWNLFHLVDARRIPASHPATPEVRALDPLAAKVLVSNGERRAEEAWRRLVAAKVPNVYILAGGINGWLDAYGVRPEGARAAAADSPDDTMRHRFAAALGDRYPFARPDPETAPKRAFTPKVRLARPAKGPSGGCGG